MAKRLSIVIVVILAISIAQLWHLHREGYHVNRDFPFIWRVSDRYQNAHRTCNILIELGFGIKYGIENSVNLGEFRSIDETVQKLKQNGLIDISTTKDGWGNPMKIKTGVDAKGSSIVIFSDTKNEFPVGSAGYNLFVHVAFDSRRDVSVKVTRVESGRIAIKEY